MWTKKTTKAKTCNQFLNSYKINCKPSTLQVTPTETVPEKKIYNDRTPSSCLQYMFVWHNQALTKSGEIHSGSCSRSTISLLHIHGKFTLLHLRCFIRETKNNIILQFGGSKKNSWQNKTKFPVNYILFKHYLA